MSLSNDLKREKQRYEEAVVNARATASELSKSINTLISALSANNASYVLNDIAGGGSFLEDILEDERRIYNTIQNSIIPSAKSKIADLEVRIARAKKKEAEAAAAAAES